MIRSHQLSPLAKIAGLPGNAWVVSARRVPRFIVVADERDEVFETVSSNDRLYAAWTWSSRRAHTWRVLDLTGQSIMWRYKPLHVPRTVGFAPGMLGQPLPPFPSEMQPIFCLVQEAGAADIQRILDMMKTRL